MKQCKSEIVNNSSVNQLSRTLYDELRGPPQTDDLLKTDQESVWIDKDISISPYKHIFHDFGVISPADFDIYGEIYISLFYYLHSVDRHVE